MRLIAILAALFFALPAGAGYVLNGAGPSGVYSIFRVDDLGSPTDNARIIDPSGSGFDASHVYWPSAVKVGTDIYVYATGHDASGNLSLGLWISTNGVTFSRFGQVLAPAGDEGQIGMSHVAHDPDDKAAPFKVWYTTRYTTPPGRGTEVRYATSTDGKSWTRVGTVLTAAESGATDGVSTDYVCKDGDTWRLLYGAGYDSPLKFRADEATSTTPGGAFTRTGTIFSPGGIDVAVTTTLTAGTRYIPVASVSGIAAGDVLVISDGTQSKVQRIEVEKVNTTYSAVISTEPVYAVAASQRLRSVYLNKMSPSFVYRDANNDLVGHFTGWGQWPGTLSEYTFAVKRSGQTFVNEGKQLFRPFGPGNFYSFENPSPIRTGVDCGLPN
jgi:hypothetical protein